jgi:ribosomal protein S6--L-glutamate ligase
MHLGILANENSWYLADLERAARERGDRVSRLVYPQLSAWVRGHESTLRCGELDLGTLDGLIVRTMSSGSLEQIVFRMDVLASFQATGRPVLNPPKAIECAVDKYLTTARLEAAGLPVPATVVCENSETAMLAFEALGRDVVVKPIFGAEGRGICRVSDPDLAFRTFRTLERTQAVLYLQRFVDHEGADVRVLVLDGEILGAVKRSNPLDFRTNVSRQATAATYEPNDHERELALRATAATGARFAGIDLLYDRGGTCFVIEVNAVPGWRAFGRATDLDVASRVLAAVHRPP